MEESRLPQTRGAKQGKFVLLCPTHQAPIWTKLWGEGMVIAKPPAQAHTTPLQSPEEQALLSLPRSPCLPSCFMYEIGMDVIKLEYEHPFDLKEMRFQSSHSYKGKDSLYLVGRGEKQAGVSKQARGRGHHQALPSPAFTPAVRFILSPPCCTVHHWPSH
jgi:hypothetical protein